MKWLLIITTITWSLDVTPIITSVNYIKSFSTKEACLYAGKQIVGEPRLDVRLNRLSAKCIEER